MASTNLSSSTPPPAVLTFDRNLRHATTGVDTRAVIYAWAFRDPIERGIVNVDEACKIVDDVIIARPQLVAINGRPC